MNADTAHCLQSVVFNIQQAKYWCWMNLCCEALILFVNKPQKYSYQLLVPSYYSGKWIFLLSFVNTVGGRQTSHDMDRSGLTDQGESTTYFLSPSIRFPVSRSSCTDRAISYGSAPYRLQQGPELRSALIRVIPSRAHYTPRSCPSFQHSELQLLQQQ